jgi:hypothetical protein
MNNMGREIMAALKRFQVGSDGDGVTVGGALVVSGSTTLTTVSATVVQSDTVSEKTSAAGVTIDGVLLKDNGASLGGNLTFTGTGNRITGDFSNATNADRVSFQSSTVNGFTQINAIPNGTSQVAGFTACNNSNPTNSSFLRILPSATEARIQSGIFGTGTYLPMTFYTNDGERMRIDTSGNVGIGTTSPIGKIHSTGGFISTGLTEPTDGGASGSFQIGYNGTTGVLRTFASSPIRFDTAGVERARIDTSGNLLVGTTTTTNTVVGSRLFPNGGAHFTETTTGDGPLTQFVNINASIANGYRFASFRINSGGTEKGTITYNTGTGQVNYNQTSDRRLKTNIQPSKSALDVLSQVQIMSFDMIEGGHTNFGVIAQDLDVVFPEAVSPGDDKEIVEKAWGVDTSNLVPALVKAIQELSAKNDALEARIAALEGAQA